MTEEKKPTRSGKRWSEDALMELMRFDEGARGMVREVMTEIPKKDSDERP